MRKILLLVLLVMTGCGASQPVRNEQTKHVDLRGYNKIAVGPVHFSQKEETQGLDKIYSEKLRTEIFKHKLGDNFTKTPDSKTLIITTYIDEISHGQANVQIMLAVVGLSKVSGRIELQDANKQVLYTMDISAINPPISAYGLSSYVTSDMLMGITAESAVENIANIMKENNQ